jgi:hypothetical protein
MAPSSTAGRLSGYSSRTGLRAGSSGTVDEEWVKAITAGAKNPNNWHARARGLKRSADALFEKWRAIQPALFVAGTQMSLLMGDRGDKREAAIADWSELLDESLSYGAPAMMLVGFAVECYLKGILVLRDPSVVKPPPYLFEWDHRLPTLAKQAKIDVNEQEAELLERLTTFTTWGGRYPAPRKPRDAKGPDETGLGPVHWSTDDLPIVDLLVRRLHETLWNGILQKGKESQRDSAGPEPAAGSNPGPDR